MNNKTKLLLLSIFAASTIQAQINFETTIALGNLEDVADSSIAFADVDGDNDMDLLITGRNNSADAIAISKLYTNDGSGNYTEVTGTTFEGVTDGSIAFADVDGDNDMDLLITGRNNSTEPISTLYTNDGSGNYTEVTGTPFDAVFYSSIAFADVDGDNDMDLLITGQNNSADAIAISKLYTNDGSGNYTEVTGTPFDGVYHSSIAFADVDGDNDMDLLITGQISSGNAISTLYTNDGSGNYTEVTGTTFEGVAYGSIAFADVDGDNDMDLLITGINNSTDPISTLYTNDGSGNYTEVTDTPFEGVSSSSIAFADVDGDNDMDLLITGIKISFDGISTLYTNDGSGNYTEVTDTPFDGVKHSSIAFADVDGDNDMDLLITGRISSTDAISTLYTNDGSGNYTEVTGTPFDAVYYSSIAFADVDGDNDMDLLITGQISIGNAISTLYTNDGSGNYTEVTDTPFEGVTYGSIAFADVDGDNDMDLLITGQSNSLEDISTLYTNDGSGNYTEVTGTPFDAVYYSSIAFADVDGDNDMDLLITGIKTSADAIAISTLYTNDGSGNYTEVTGTPFDGVYFSSIAFADVDGDNDMDLLITGRISSTDAISTLYTNDGSGNYTEVTGTPFEGVSSSSIAFADVDGDNDMDLLITGLNNSADDDGISTLYTNDGSGNYTEVTGTPFDGVFFSSIAFADVDGDNDMDLLITGQSNSLEDISTLYTNDGSGNYTEVTDTPFDGVYHSSIAFADVDGDNDMDLLITGINYDSFGAISKLYLNITPQTVGLIENKINDVLVYPNPTNGAFNISLQSDLQEVHITVIDVLGKKVYAKTYANTNSINLELKQPSGMYFVEVRTKESSKTIRLIKK